MMETTQNIAPAFSRAFRQWTGRAPARYRRHHGRG